jgi:hypothetical protein
MNLRKKTVIFSYAMVNPGITKINFNCFFSISGYSNTSTGFIGGFTMHIMHSATFFNVNNLIKDK